MLFVEAVSLHSGRQNKCIYALTPGLADGRERQPGTRAGLVTASEIQRSAFALDGSEESSLMKQQCAGCPQLPSRAATAAEEDFLP